VRQPIGRERADTRHHVIPAKAGTPDIQVAVRFDHVSKRFIIHRDRPRSFQEWVVSAFRRSDDREEMWALRDVSFTVHRGEAVAFVGANGAGKSSLLKLVSGILAPTEGVVTVDGRLSGLLELGAGFHPDLTGRENIYLNGSILGLDRRELDRLFPTIVRFAELETFIDMPIKHYSSGMYMRLGFSVAIHAQPDILLVDEVLAVGDAAFQAKCMNRIVDLKKRGMTILLVSHDLESVRKLCDQAIWLEQSRVQASGSPHQVIARYLDHVAQREFEQRGQGTGDREEGTGDRSQGPETESGASSLLEEGGIGSDGTGVDQSPVSNLQSSLAVRWGTREVEITGVEFLGGDGQPRDAFDTGETLVARIHYMAHQPVAHPMIGIAIHDEDGAHVTGPNNVYAGVDIPRLAGAGWIDYIVDDLPLLAGTYIFTAALYDYWETAAYDHHDKTYVFRVRPGDPERYGLVKLSGRWEHRETGMSPVMPTQEAPLLPAGRGGDSSLRSE
jgi:ABC-type polysaccharide/polyol phosphate transport system ATPase subunit